MQEALADAMAPDLIEPAARARTSWQKLLNTEAEASARILVNTLEPYQREIEHHFALEAQHRFHGIMATYLRVFTGARYVGSKLRDRMPFLPRIGARVETPAAWNLGEFTAACTKVAGEQHLDARVRALGNKLLVEASNEGFRVDLLSEPTEKASRLDWRQRFAQRLINVLAECEQQWARPTGWRRWMQAGTIWIANHLPLYTLFAAFVFLLGRYTIVREMPHLGDILLPVMMVFIVLVILHIIVSCVLPMRWPAMRNEFQRRLERSLRDEFKQAYLAIPERVAEGLLEERKRTQGLIDQTRDVASWLSQREEAARIDALYGD
jgi:hypothetical protein